MKPSAPAASANNSTTSKNSLLQKRMKKSTKSRSKNSKSGSGLGTSLGNSAGESSNSSNVTAVQQTTNSTPEKEKSSHKNYAGFGPKTIKIIWEQYDTSDTDIMSEVFIRMAEDVTYRVWALANNAKTYAKHSGGKVTCELINEVLKDSDVAPILGAGSADWERIDYDESFFFDADKILELRDEYLKEIETKQPVCSEVLSSWVLDRKYSKQLFDFSSCLSKAIFLGDYEAFKFGIETAAFAPQIGCCLKLIFRKCIEVLAFEQKNPIIERCLKFLQAISFNPYSRDADSRQQLFHLSEIIICLLLDSINSIKREIHYEVHPKMEERKEESFELVKNFLENSDQDMKKDVEALNQMDVDDIRSEYEALFQMMERDGFQEREPNDINIQDIKPEENDNQNHDPIHQEVQILSDADVKNLSFVIQDESNFNSSFYNESEINLEFSPFSAVMLDYKYVDLICRTLGCMSSQFGYFQTECLYLIVKRMEKFFEGHSKIYSEEEYQYISRSVKGLCVLGEFAFREIIPFLYNIDDVPEWMYNDFSLTAVFLNGADDIFLYEWLQDICGADKLQPFMIHSMRYHQKLITRRCKAQKLSTFKVEPKIVIKSRQKTESIVRHDINEYFPERAKLIKLPGKIGFKFSGCRPVLIKLKTEKTERTNDISLRNFCSKIVIGHRKLLKPLTNKKKFGIVSNFCFTQI